MREGVYYNYDKRIRLFAKWTHILNYVTYETNKIYHTKHKFEYFTESSYDLCCDKSYKKYFLDKYISIVYYTVNHRVRNKMPLFTVVLNYQRLELVSLMCWKLHSVWPRTAMDIKNMK